MRSENWSYQDLTEAAEREISLLGQHAIQNVNSDGEAVMRQWAFGVFSFWSTVTVGCRTIGDYERLEALTEQVGRLPSGNGSEQKSSLD